MNPDRLDFLTQPENEDELREVLLYHLIPGETLTSDFPAGPSDTLLADTPVQVSFSSVNPPPAVPDIMFDDAKVDVADNAATNGVFNILDGVLDPFFNPFCSQFDFGGGSVPDTNEPNILEVARQDPQLSVFVSLFELANLDPILACPGKYSERLVQEYRRSIVLNSLIDHFSMRYNQSGPFTANLPTNNAFENMDPNRLEFLVQPENISELQDVLLYHLLPRETLTTDFVAGPTATLLPSFPVEVNLSPALTFDEGTVEDRDKPASNGVFNTLDAVLDPYAERKWQ